MPILPRDATWNSFSTAWCRKLPITSPTILREATTCRHTFAWSSRTPAKPCRLRTEKCSSERGKAFSFSNIAARHIGGRFLSPLLENDCSGEVHSEPEAGVERAVLQKIINCVHQSQ